MDRPATKTNLYPTDTGEILLRNRETERDDRFPRPSNLSQSQSENPPAPGRHTLNLTKKSRNKKKKKGEKSQENSEINSSPVVFRSFRACPGKRRPDLQHNL
jgi:hypothetical protein